MDLPDWLTPLPDAAQIRAVDRCAIEERGIPGSELMEHAGVAAARAAERLAPDGEIVVLCGTGNNGGDGFVLARELRAAGRSVDVRLVGDETRISPDARANLERLPGDAPTALDGALQPAALIVDALLGTGFAGDVRGAAAAAIDAVNGARVPVLALDVPSGVDATTGETGEHAVDAAHTVTFHAAKAGLWINPGKRHAGTIEVADIGIPQSIPTAASCGLIEPECAALLPRRGPASTKFSCGQLVLVGGSSRLAGAPRLAGRGAMRAGAGYVTVGVPAAIQPSVAEGMPELIGLALPETTGALGEDAADDLLELAKAGVAFAIGPGLGRADATQQLVKRLVRELAVPFVLDADGLFAFAGWAGELANRGAPAVLTPHTGELARLLGCTSAELDARRLENVRRAAELTGCVVVLKGDDTLIAAPGGPVAVSAGNAPALATAGTGDVLCGAVGALLAQGVEPFHAACAAVWLHARAGQLAAGRAGAAEGVLASDVAELLPKARGEAAGR